MKNGITAPNRREKGAGSAGKRTGADGHAQPARAIVDPFSRQWEGEGLPRREKVASHNTRSAHTRTREKGDRQ